MQKGWILEHYCHSLRLGTEVFFVAGFISCSLVGLSCLYFSPFKERVPKSDQISSCICSSIKNIQLINHQVEQEKRCELDFV